MKLNLLPTYVSKEKSAKTGMILGILVALAGVAGAVGMIVLSSGERKTAYDDMTSKIGDYAKTVALAKSADTVIEQARPIITNINLAEAMTAHNSVYPDLFDEIRRYIPSFFRLTSMRAAPAGPDAATVNLTGVIQTQQQYADLMLALLRIPKATGVTRDGYQMVSPTVPALTPEDQFGRPLKPGGALIPDDPEARLDYYIAQGQLTGFQSVGGFGGEPGQRGAMPEWSEINVTVLLPRKLQTPNPRATLAAGGGGGTQGGVPATAGPPSAGPPKGIGSQGGGREDE